MIKKILLILAFLPLVQYATSAESLAVQPVDAFQSIAFSPQEQQWLDKKQALTYVYDPDWAPFEWKNDVAQHSGIIADIMKIIKQRTGIIFIATNTKTWTESVELVKKSKVEIFSAITQTGDREKYLNFTSKDLFTYPAVLVTQFDDKNIYLGIKQDFKNKKIGIVKSSGLGAYIREKNPELNFIEVSSTHEGFYMLEKNKIDSFAINSITAKYFIKKRGFNNLKIALKLNYIYHLKIAIHKSQPKEIISILNKALISLSQDKLNTIFSKWTDQVIIKQTNWELVAQIIAITLLIVFLFVWNIRKLNLMVRGRTEELKRVNNQLTESITGLDKAQKIAHLGSWELDLVDNSLFWSKEVYSIFEIESDSYIPSLKKFLAFIPLSDRQLVTENIDNALHQQQPYNIEHRLILPNGCKKIVYERAEIEFDEQGKALKLIGTIHDITKRKGIENKLKQSEEKFRTITENSQMGIFIYTDYFVYANKALIDISGYSLDEFYKMRPWELMDKPFQEQVKKITHRRLAGEHFPQQYNDLRLKGKYGDLITVRISTETIKYKDCFAGMGIIVDISDIKKTQKQLKLLSQAIEQSDELIRITDKNGLLTYVNDAFVAHTGYKHAELIGKSSGIIKSGNHDSSFYKDLWQTIQSGKTFNNTIINRKKDGQIYHEELMITPMLDGHKETQYYVATGKDITARISMEKELVLRATTDYLTGLYNRQKGNEILDSEIDRVQRYDSSLALIMLDIDKFKNINDVFGHDIGDKVLIQLSRIISFHIRKSDSFIRWGGEEFIVISPQNSEKEIILFAEKLRREVDSYLFEVVDHISISVGITLFNKNERKTDLLKRVDNALFKAKSAGRNCVKYM